MLQAFAIHLYCRINKKYRMFEHWKESKPGWLNVNRFKVICSSLAADFSKLPNLLGSIWTELITPGNVYIFLFYIIFLQCILILIIYKYLAIDETIFAFKGECPTRRTILRKPGSHDTGILVYFIGGRYETSSLPFVLNCSPVVQGKHVFFAQQIF